MQYVKVFREETMDKLSEKINEYCQATADAMENISLAIHPTNFYTYQALVVFRKTE